jgi:hypothetical protein
MVALFPIPINVLLEATSRSGTAKVPEISMTRAALSLA